MTISAVYLLPSKQIQLTVELHLFLGPLRVHLIPALDREQHCEEAVGGERSTDSRYCGLRRDAVDDQRDLATQEFLDVLRERRRAVVKDFARTERLEVRVVL